MRYLEPLKSKRDRKRKLSAVRLIRTREAEDAAEECSSNAESSVEALTEDRRAVGEPHHQHHAGKTELEQQIRREVAGEYSAPVAVEEVEESLEEARARWSSLNWCDRSEHEFDLKGALSEHGVDDIRGRMGQIAEPEREANARTRGRVCNRSDEYR